MAENKKSYLNNPALQFISSALVEDVRKETREDPVRKSAAPRPHRSPKDKPARPAPPVPEPVPAPLDPPVPESVPNPRPAPAYDPPPTQEPTEAFLLARGGRPGQESVPMKPIYIEVRSKRVNALLQPSLYKKLLTISRANGVSVNETIHRALERFACSEEKRN